MFVALRSSLLAFALVVLPVVAAAADYVVVRSNDAAFVRGQGFDAGDRVSLPVGKTITLMHASGEVVTFKGAAGGFNLPKRVTAPKDADRLAVLRFILSKAPRQDGGRATRSRGGVCPPVAAITTLDAIVQVQQGGCSEQAAQALEAFLDAAPDSTP